MTSADELATEEPFSTVLSRAVQKRNLTLERLSARLKALDTPVSIATLSYWQSGRSLPTRARSLKAVEHLERILELSPGHLSSALPGDAFSRWDPISVLRPEEQLNAVLAGMGMDLNRHFTTLTLQDSITVSADGLRHLQVTRQLVRAEHDGVWHTPAVLSNSDTSDEAPGLEAGLGCTIGQLAVLEDSATVVGELVLPQPLMRGDLAMFEYRVLWEEQQPETGFSRSLASAIPFLVLEATFEGEPPAWARYERLSPDSEERLAHTDLTPGPHVQAALRDVPGGIHALDWGPAGTRPPSAGDEG